MAAGFHRIQGDVGAVDLVDVVLEDEPGLEHQLAQSTSVAGEVW